MWLHENNIVESGFKIAITTDLARKWEVSGPSEIVAWSNESLVRSHVKKMVYKIPLKVFYVIIAYIYALLLHTLTY